MIYLYKDPKGENILEKPTSQFHSALESTPKQQQQSVISFSTITSGDKNDKDKDKKELIEILRNRDKTIQEKERIIMDLRSALNGSSVD